MLAPALLILLAAVAAAVPINERRQALAPAVSIKNGIVIGSSLNGTDSFKGIPFAEPPTGTLRLRPPQTYSTSFPNGSFTATGTPTACPQFASSIDITAIPDSVLESLAALADEPFAKAVTIYGEDCLTVNVQRPSGTNSTSKLPVVFWIFGGGFEFGSTQAYDASSFISKSVSLGHPVLYVSVNYRVAGFGFLAGKELTAEGSTNLGLRDQRLGLEWVADNIAAFGGDPAKVTIWGESAGSISVFDHTIINGGDNTYHGKALFHGAIMDSGSITPAVDTRHPKPQAVYDTVVANASCSTSNDTLACLRALPYKTFLTAVNSLPGLLSYSSQDLAYLPRPDPGSAFFPVSPEVAIAEGKYAKVPIIIGDQQDEGTLFSLAQTNITNATALVDYLQTYYPNPAGKAAVAGLVATYPANASAGSPYGTGDLYEIYPEYKRLAAILGDMTFTLVRRSYLASVAPCLPGAWSYLDDHLQGTPVFGTFHGSDILEAYESSPSLVTADAFMTYYTSFINYLNPNTISTAAPLIEWPEWSNATGAPQLINFLNLTNQLITDDFRSASYDYIRPRISLFRT